MARGSAIALAAAALLIPALSAADLPTTVEFAPAVSAKMPDYGQAEQATLESAVTAAVSHETDKTQCGAGLTLKVTLEDVAPSHPTREQLDAHPSMDPYYSWSLGGAQLAGELRDAGGHPLTTVHYRSFADDFASRSVAFDPWADARRAFDNFAVKVASACRALPR